MTTYTDRTLAQPGVLHKHGESLMDAQIAALTARVTKLEAGAAVPTPTPVPPPVVTPPPVIVPTQPQVVSVLPALADYADIKNLVINPASNLTVQDQVAASPSSGVYAKGRKFIKLTNVVTTGREWGFQLVDCDDVIATDCGATDLNYCGWGIFGGKRGQLIRAFAKRVGSLRGSTGLPSIGDAGNAYGFKFENSSQAFQSGTLNLDPDTWLVDGWLVEDVPQWQGVNSHGAANLTIQNGISRRCPRGIFLVGHHTNANVLSNQVLEPAGLHSFGSTDQSAITYGGWTGGSIDGNKIATAYATPLNDLTKYGFPSSGVVVGSNQVV